MSPFEMSGFISKLEGMPLALHRDRADINSSDRLRATEIAERDDSQPMMILDSHHCSLLHFFQSHTVLWLGSAETAHIYQATLLRLAASHAFLMHTLLHLALMHVRHSKLGPSLLNKPPHVDEGDNFRNSVPPPSDEEVFHGYHGAAMMNARLGIHAAICNGNSPPTLNSDSPWPSSFASFLPFSSPWSVHTTRPNADSRLPTVPHSGRCQVGSEASYDIDREKDALWGAAALLGAATFASLDTYDTSTLHSAACWPFDHPYSENEVAIAGVVAGPDPLCWLKMSDGKREVWKIANPMRVGSIFRDSLLIEKLKRDTWKITEIGPREMDMSETLWDGLTELYEFDERKDAAEQEADRRRQETAVDAQQPSSTARHIQGLEIHDHSNAEVLSALGSPYQTALSILRRLTPIPCTHSTILWFLSFLGHMDPRLRNLIEQKDDRALLLLLWWYALLRPYTAWWVQRRAYVQGLAIHAWLSKSLNDKSSISCELLEWLKVRGRW